MAWSCRPALAAVLVQKAAAAVPSAMILSTLKTARLSTTGVVPPRISALTEGALRAMLLKKLKLATLMILMVALLGLGGGFLASWTGAGAAKAQGSLSPKADKPKDPDRPGDALPDGSLLRLGTSRYRNGTPINSLSISADGKLAAATNEMHWLGTTRVFDLTDGRPLFSFERGHGLAEAVALSPDGKILASKEHQGLVFRNPTTGEEIRKANVPEAGKGGTITSWAQFTPDGKAVALTSSGKRFT